MRARWLALGMVLLGVAWLCAPSPRTREGHAAAATQIHARPPTPGRTPAAQLLAAARRAPAAERAHERPADGRPHPVTPEHLRLYSDVDLLRAAEAAIKAGKYAEARALIAQHHRELSGMSAPEEEGLLLLADCAEQRSASNLARVQRFYDRHTDSMLRRRLRRSCLEAPAAADRAAVQ